MYRRFVFTGIGPHEKLFPGDYFTIVTDLKDAFPNVYNNGQTIRY